jgi:hypothetical protein
MTKSGESNCITGIFHVSFECKICKSFTHVFFPVVRKTLVPLYVTVNEWAKCHSENIDPILPFGKSALEG